MAAPQVLVLDDDTADARRLALALEESERRFRLTFENAPIGIVHTDPSRRVIMANSRFCELVGVSRSEIVGRDVSVFSPPADVARVQKIVDELVAGTRTTAQYERRFVRGDGTIAWAAVTLFCATERGKLEYVVGLVEDITERERARAALAESEERYRSVVEGASKIIFTIDTAGRFLTLNAAFEKVTGRSRAEWIGRDAGEIIGTTDLLRRVIGERVPSSAEVRIDGGVLVEVTLIPKIERGRITMMFGFARDITAARRAQQNLELLLNSTAEGIFAVDTNGRCTLINRAGAALLGRNPADFLGRPMPCAIDDVLRTGTPSTMTTDVFMRADGTTFPVEYSASPVLEDSVAIGVVVTFIDVTERRKLEARLEQANRLTSLGRLAATIAHEFNNVLMGISPFVEVIRRGNTTEHVSNALDHMGSAIRRGKRITEEILRFTQPGEPLMVPIAVETWLAGIEAEARSILMPSNHAIATVIEDPSLTVCGDPTHLHQVFTNLIINARDAMEGGGLIVIRARREQPGTRFPYGLVDQPERFAHFIVEDSGCGMSAETLRHIFEPLFTTKKSGTGIGLAVTHQMVQRHGGAIFVETEPGAGASFHLFIPLWEPKEAPRTRVLLVEDDHAVAAGIAALLELEGMSVQIAENGDDAITIAASWAPDIAVIDVGLPDIDGAAAYRRMNVDVPVIFSSGEGSCGRLGDLLARNNVSVLVKPYEIDELYAAIRKLLP